MVYFDHNATTPLDERVLEVMQPYLTSFYGNPSSLYRQGRIARSAVDTAREQLASLCDVQPNQIIFTSGGTEANNQAFLIAREYAGLAVSTIEHPSVIEPAQWLQKIGCSLDFIEVDSDGVITSQAIEQIIDKKISFVSMMLANNETGVLQNISAFAQQLRSHNIIFHTDAVQALGKIPVSFQQLAVHLMTVSSHKIYGPKGCGALIFDKDIQIQSILLGGGQERRMRAGTENVAAIVGFGKAAELAEKEFTCRNAYLLKLRLLFERLLAGIPNVTIFAQDSDRLPNTVQFSVEGLDGEMLLMRLDQKGFAVSSGSACASGGLEPSPVLIAMGVDVMVAKTAIRVSFGKTNTENEVFEFIRILQVLIKQ